MNWRQRIAAYARHRNLPAVLTTEGVALDFRDGYDTCWLLPGEVTSFLPVATPEPDVPALIGEFERIDRLRTSVLQVIRHNLAERRFFVDRRASGKWGVMTPGGLSSTISVGPFLTARAAAGLDVHQLVAACYEHTLLGKPPSRRRVDRYLATDGPPPNERPWPDEPPTITCFATLRSLLLLSGLCKAAEGAADLTSREKVAQAVLPTGRLGQVLLHLADRLPQAPASCDVTDCSLALDFDDEEDDFPLTRRSRDLARRVRSVGVQAAGDQLADEYLRLNAARGAVLNAVKRAASARGWGLQRIRPFFLSTGIPATWQLGRTRREVELPVGQPLTDLLRTASPEQALRQLLAPHPAFAEECVAALAAGGPPVTLPDGNLGPAPPMRQPTLRILDADTVAEMDAFADRTLAAHLRSEQTIGDYRRANRFDPSCDTWATTPDWVALAEGLIGGDWPDPTAVLVLVDAGDPRGLERARFLLHRMEPHHEVSDAEVELAWRFRHERPEVARNWFVPQPFEQVPYAEQLSAGRAQGLGPHGVAAVRQPATGTPELGRLSAWPAVGRRTRLPQPQPTHAGPRQPKQVLDSSEPA
jgi:hypothetical protein